MESPRTGYQFMEGVEMQLPSSIRLRVAGFRSGLTASSILGTSVSGVGHSEGVEVFLHRAFTERLGGFLSYTLSRTTGATLGPEERTTWDRTHVLTAIAGYDLGNSWRVGARLFVESGRPSQSVCAPGPTCPPGKLYTPSTDLPVFFRLDARLEKKWTFRGGQWLTGVVECFNLMDRAEPIGDQYSPQTGITVRTQSPIILPSIGVEGGL
jgi:hypothetical protein